MRKQKSHLKSAFSAEYQALRNAIHRCHNDQHVCYHDYGARGIKVVDEWRTMNGFPLFLDHIGPKPSSDYSLDRIDNNKGYEPGNVRWTDRKTQQNNRRPFKRDVQDFGWGISYSRPTKSGRGHGGRLSPLVPCYGRTQTIADWTNELGLSGPTIRGRLMRGLTPEQALCTDTSRVGEKRKMAPNALLLPTIH